MAFSGGEAVVSFAIDSEKLKGLGNFQALYLITGLKDYIPPFLR